MDKLVTITGRMTDTSHIALDQAVPGLAGGSAVQVTLQPIPSSDRNGRQTLGEFLQSLPPGRRSKDEIDAQIDEERSSWGE